MLSLIGGRINLLISNNLNLRTLVEVTLTQKDISLPSEQETTAAKILLTLAKFIDIESMLSQSQAWDSAKSNGENIESIFIPAHLRINHRIRESLFSSAEKDDPVRTCWVIDNLLASDTMKAYKPYLCYCKKRIIDQTIAFHTKVILAAARQAANDYLNREVNSNPTLPLYQRTRDPLEHQMRAAAQTILNAEDLNSFMMVLESCAQADFEPLNEMIIKAMSALAQNPGTSFADIMAFVTSKIHLFEEDITKRIGTAEQLGQALAQSSPATDWERIITTMRVRLPSLIKTPADIKSVTRPLRESRSSALTLLIPQIDIKQIWRDANAWDQEEELYEKIMFILRPFESLPGEFSDNHPDVYNMITRLTEIRFEISEREITKFLKSLMAELDSEDRAPSIEVLRPFLEYCLENLETPRLAVRV